MAEDTTPDNSPIAEISQGPSKFESFLENNQKLVVLVVLLIVLAVIGFVVQRDLKEQAINDAGAALIAAESDIDKLRAVMAEHGDTAAAGTAAVRLASALKADGKEAESLETLETFLSNFPEHPARAMAQARLGSSYVQQGDDAKAKVAFEAVLNETGSDAYDYVATMALGDIAYAADDMETARGHYEAANAILTAAEIPTNPRDPYSALRRLDLIAIGTPELVAPPAPPEPAADLGEAPAPPSAVTEPVVVPPAPAPAVDTPAPAEVENAAQEETTPPADPAPAE